MGSAVESVGHVTEIDRRTCRAVFEERFTVERMTSEYVALYKRYSGEKPEAELLEYDEPTPPAILQ
jgi:hypothetical protein